MRTFLKSNSWPRARLHDMDEGGTRPKELAGHSHRRYLSVKGR